MKKSNETFLNAFKNGKTKNEIIILLKESGYSTNSAKWYYYKLLKQIKNETNK